MRVKGIKRGKNIEIFEDIDIYDSEKKYDRDRFGKIVFGRAWSAFDKNSIARESGSNQKFLREFEIRRQVGR